MNFPLYPAKIVLAILVPLTAGICLGWLALARFEGASLAGDVPADGAVAPVVLSERLERRVLLTAYNLRGYDKSGEKSFLEAAKRDLAAAMETLHELRPIGAAVLAGSETPKDPPRSSNFETSSVLRDPKASFASEPPLLDRTASLLDAYKEQAELTVAAHDALSVLRDEFDAAAGAYAAAVAQAEKVARGKLDIGLGVPYPPLEKVRLRRRQLDILERSAGFGAKLFEAVRQGQLDRKPFPSSDAAKYFSLMRETLDQYEAAGLEEETENLAAMRVAAAGYEKRTLALLDGWAAVSGAGENLLRDEAALMEAVSAVASRTLGNAEAVARELASNLVWSRRMMRAGMLVLALFGVVWIALAATALSGPVVKCARYARELAKENGNAPQSAPPAGWRGEVGVLADALREIAKRLGRS